MVSETSGVLASLSTLDKTTLLLCSAAICLLVYIWQLVSDPLRSVPGPFLTRFTRLWELHAIRQGGFEKKTFDLHQQYGPIVRLGPNRYSISDPLEADKIYRHGSKFMKTSFYHAFGNPDASKADIFSERSIERHAMNRRKVTSLYSMSTLVSYEQFVDRCTTVLCEKMHDFAKSGSAIQVPQWMQFYAFDVIGEISVGESFGFMEKGYDFNGILAAIHDSLTYGSRVGILPEFHPKFAWLAKTTKMAIPFDVVEAFIQKNIDARRDEDLPAKENDFLAKLLNLRDSGKLDDLDVHTTMGANIAAGSDTTAIALSSVIYYLTKNPEKAANLRREIHDCQQKGIISDPVSFKEAQEMPYLQAVIKEALRIHPATGQTLARIVPPEGTTLCGQFFPGGTEVGTNPWLTHFDEDVFGPDTRSFIPERWLESSERASKMNQHMLSFGAGARTCIGKNISLLEMTKVIPQLYRRFDFELDEPDEEWELDMVWFVKQKFNCRVKVL